MSRPSEPAAAPSTSELAKTAELPAVPTETRTPADGGAPAGPGVAAGVPPSVATAAAEPPQGGHSPASPPIAEYPPPPPPVAVGHASPPSGVVGVVPDLGVPPVPLPTAPSRRRISYGPRARSALLGLGLVALSALLLVVGLTSSFGTVSLWSAIPLWSLFAVVAALLGLLAFVPDAPGRSRLHPHLGWKVAVVGLVGLALFWLLVVLPGVATDRGFVLTAALAALSVALWIAPSRKD